MSWPCPVCQKDFSRKDNLQRHMNSKHSDSNFAPVIPMSQEKCQRFQLVHPFTYMVAGMTGSGKTVWVQSLLQQAQTVIDQAPERIIWCYSQWQNAYTQLLMMIPTIEFVKGIPESLENDSYLDVNKRNLIVIDDQMIEAGKDNRIVNLFTKGSHHRNLSVIYIVQNLFHQGKGNRSISLNSHYLILFKNPRDKLQILTLAKQMYPSETAWFIKEYEEAVRRPYGYLFVDLRPTTPDRCRLRTNVLPGEERFDKGFEENRISQELLRYLKQQTLTVPPPISEMQRIQNNMDNLLYRANLEEDQRAKQYMQHSRPQSLRSFWPAAGIESSGSNHYERTKEITEFWLSGSLRICIYGACLKWLLPELSIPAAGQKDRRLWGRECTCSCKTNF